MLQNVWNTRLFSWNLSEDVGKCTTLWLSHGKNDCSINTRVSNHKQPLPGKNVDLQKTPSYSKWWWSRFLPFSNFTPIYRTTLLLHLLSFNQCCYSFISEQSSCQAVFFLHRWKSQLKNTKKIVSQKIPVGSQSIFKIFCRCTSKIFIHLKSLSTENENILPCIKS